MVFKRRHLCLLLKTMTSALFARDALSSALHRFSTAYCETGGFSAGHCARHLWHWSKSWAGICGIGWKIAAVFVLIDSVAFGKEMYCSFIFQIARVCFSLRLYYHLWREVFFSYLNTFQLRYEPWHEHNRSFKFSSAWLEQFLSSRTIIGAIASPSPLPLMAQLSY